MQMMGIGKRGNPDHRWQFQGQETQSDFGLHWAAFDLRSLDVQLGRWCQIDPYNQYSSPYVGLGNSPINGIDPDGGLFFGLFGSTSEQRQAARAAAEELGGRVNNVLSKNISVTYWRTGKTGVGNDGLSNFLTTEHQIDFRENGKIDHGSPNINRAKDLAERNNQPKASGKLDPFYLVQNPIESLIQAGAAAADGDLEGMALAATAPLLAGKAAKIPNRGGRLGNAATRKQIEEIAQELKGRGYTIIGGGGEAAEEYLKPMGKGRRGGSYPDITATHPGYPTLRINTVDVLKDGITPTIRERRNASRIRKQIAPGEHLILIPKQ